MVRVSKDLNVEEGDVEDQEAQKHGHYAENVWNIPQGGLVEELFLSSRGKDAHVHAADGDGGQGEQDEGNDPCSPAKADGGFETGENDRDNDAGKRATRRADAQNEGAALAEVLSEDGG